MKEPFISKKDPTCETENGRHGVHKELQKVTSGHIIVLGADVLFLSCIKTCKPHFSGFSFCMTDEEIPKSATVLLRDRLGGWQK